MEMSDIFFVAALEWVHDKLEERFGRAVAWITTFLLSISSLAAIAAIAWYLLWK